MIKSFLNLFRTVKKDEFVIEPLPVSDVDNFFMKLQKPLNNLVSFLKETYSYDRVTYYSFDQPFSNYSKKARIILEDALINIFGVDHVSSKLERLSNFQFIVCDRVYDNTHTSDYIQLYHFDNPDGKLRILLDGDESHLGFLRIPFISLNGVIGLENRKFLEYREIYDENLSEFPVFRTLDNIYSKVISVRKTPPILDILYYPYNESDYPLYEYREADFIIKKYFDPSGFEYCLFELRYVKEIIKTKTIKIDCLVFDINKEVDEFLFPLLEKTEMLDAIHLVPTLSVEFMSQDFSDFIAVKNMTVI
jgi:hypothetical protein